MFESFGGLALQVLVLTLHGALYLMDLSVPRPQDVVPKDPEELLERISEVNEEIKLTEQAIKEENARLKEVSVATSAGHLKDTFRLQVEE